MGIRILLNKPFLLGTLFFGLCLPSLTFAQQEQLSRTQANPPPVEDLPCSFMTDQEMNEFRRLIWASLPALRMAEAQNPRPVRIIEDFARRQSRNNIRESYRTEPVAKETLNRNYQPTTWEEYYYNPGSIDYRRMGLPEPFGFDALDEDDDLGEDPFPFTLFGPHRFRTERPSLFRRRPAGWY